MNSNKKIAAVVITAVAITGSASALANAAGTKAKSVSKSVTTKTTVTTSSKTFMTNGAANMGGMRGPGGHVTNVLTDLVTKGTITAAESKAVSDAWAALETAEHAAGATPTAPTTPPTAGQISPELTKALADLVSKGTLTSAKSKAITDAIAAAEAAEAANRPALGANGAMPGPKGGFQNSNKDAVITATLGIDATTLHTRLAAGDSLATIAGAKKDALIAALVADESKQIDAAVTAGKLTAAQATTIKADLTTHVTAEVNATGMGMMGGKGGPGHFGHGGPGGHDGGIGAPNGATNGIPSTGSNN